MRLRRIILLSIGLIVVISVVVVAFAALDLMSYTATGSQTLSPSGTSVGRALVVYDPGLSGAPKQAAVKVADDLKAGGYIVDLAGVRSSTAQNTSGYDIVVVGTPLYGGKASGSITDYLKGIALEKNVRLGVFARTGGSANDSNSYKMLGDQVSSLTSGNSLDRAPVIRLVRDNAVEKDCTELASALMG